MSRFSLNPPDESPVCECRYDGAERMDRSMCEIHGGERYDEDEDRYAAADDKYTGDFKERDAA